MSCDWIPTLQLEKDCNRYRFIQVNKKDNNNNDKKPCCYQRPKEQNEKATAKISVFPLFNISHSTTSIITPLHSH